jgi:hypothetical protein
MALAIGEVTMIWKGGGDEKIPDDRYDGIGDLCLLCD